MHKIFHAELKPLYQTFHIQLIKSPFIQVFTSFTLYRVVTVITYERHGTLGVTSLNNLNPKSYQTFKYTEPVNNLVMNQGREYVHGSHNNNRS